MHKIKKAAANTKGSENAEFADYKNRIDNLSAYLRESSAALNESERAWKEVCNRQKAFAEKFGNSYPDRDAVRDFGKHSALASQKLVKEFALKTEGSSAPHWQVDAVVQDYLSETTEITNEYKPLAEAQKEVVMYTKKVDDLHNAKKPDETKIARNMEKLEEAKRVYEDILDRVVDKMKLVYNKRHVALKATYVAYWSSQLRAFNLLDASLEPTRGFVEGAVQGISEIKIKQMTEEDVDAFAKEHLVAPDSKKELTSPAAAASPSAAADSGLEGAAQKVVPTSPIEPGSAPTEPPAAEI